MKENCISQDALTLANEVLNAPEKTRERIRNILNGQPADTPLPNRAGRLLTVSDAARELGLSRPTIYRLMSMGRLQRIDIGLGSPRIREEDLRTLAAPSEALGSK
jgi:excisionase family DNA binding protein